MGEGIESEIAECVEWVHDALIPGPIPPWRQGLGKNTGFPGINYSMDLISTAVKLCLHWYSYDLHGIKIQKERKYVVYWSFFV